jgi:hypothetical protein
MTEKELKALWAALSSLEAAGFSPAQIQATAKRIGL